MMLVLKLIDDWNKGNTSKKKNKRILAFSDVGKEVQFIYSKRKMLSLAMCYAKTSIAAIKKYIETGNWIILLPINASNIYRINMLQLGKEITYRSNLIFFFSTLQKL